MTRTKSSVPRLWVDMTNSPHVLVLRPIMEEFSRRGWDIVVTSREFAQTIPLLERFDIKHTIMGKHRGKKLIAKAWGMASRSSQMVRFGAGKKFDLALSHSSNDLPIAARILGIPHVTMLDYEGAKLSHSINVRFSTRALIPDAIPVQALAGYGGTPDKVDTYPGLKEEYFLADFEPNPEVLDILGLDPGNTLVVVRTPPSQAAYHRMENPLFFEVLNKIASRSDVQAVVLLRTPEQRAEVESIGAANIIVPEMVVDAQSLMYYSDLVVSAGGTMNREAAALGTPAYTVFQGFMGAVDKSLMEEGRLRLLTAADDIILEKKTGTGTRVRRDVSYLVDKIAQVAKVGEPSGGGA